MVTRPNYLAAQAWGVRPKSRRRRRRAFGALLGRSFFYLLIVLFAAMLFASFSLHQKQQVDPDIVIGIFIVSWWLGVVISALAPFSIGNRSVNARTLQLNLPDYYLAGIRGREILKGIVAPQLAGLSVFAWTHLVVAWSLLLIVIGRESGDEDMILFFILSFVSTLFNLLAGSRFALALWALYPSRVTRNALTLAMVFSSPITILSICPIPAAVLLNSRSIGVVIFAECVALMIRFPIFLSVWKKAENRLEWLSEASP